MTLSNRKITDSPAHAVVELLLCCARTRMDDATCARVRSLVENGVDWKALMRLAVRHRLVPLLYRQLQALDSALVPGDIFGQLESHFYRNTVRNHRLSEELCLLLKLFEEQSIAVVPYKGPTLAESLYGDISLREFSDLDLLIHRRDVPKASELITARGYRKQHQLTRAQEAAFQSAECEHLFSRADPQLYVDLHWQFAPAYFSLNLDAENFWPRLREGRFEGTSVLSFAPEDLMLVLCVHAAKEFWERLVWLCDIAELTRARTDLNWQQLVEQVTRAGARRILFVSLALASDLFEIQLPDEIARAIKADSAVQTLAVEIRQQLLQEHATPAAVSRYLLPARALERRRDRLRFRLRLALTPSPEDWAAVPLPDRLSQLYFLIRPVRLARKYLLGR